MMAANQTLENPSEKSTETNVLQPKEEPVITEEITSSETLGGRSRSMTEKGLVYNMDTKAKQLSLLFRKLKLKSEVIRHLLGERTPVSDIQPRYAEWLDMYETFMITNDEYCQLINIESELENYISGIHESRDIFLKNFKSAVESWMSTHTVVEIDSRSQMGRTVKSSHSSRSSGSSRSVISLSSARVREEQKKVELELEMKALQQKREIERAKLDIRMREEEHLIHTKIAISDAKTKVLEKFEQSQRGIKSEICDNYDTKLFRPHVDQSEFESMSQFHSDLNPSVKPFVPVVCNSDNDCTINTSVNVQRVNTEDRLGQKDVISDRASDCVQEIGAGGTVGDAGHVSSAQVGGTVSHHANAGNVSLNSMPNHSFTGASSDQSSLGITSSVVRFLRKPVFEIKRFGGNPMEYRKFVRQFEAKISANTENDDEKMNYLEQFTVDEAHKVVSGYSHLSAATGFPAAMKELEDRYGDSQVIAHAFIKRALDWPSIRPEDVKGLDDFSLFLVECQNAVASIQALKVLEYSENMRKLIGKLPFFLHDRWRNVGQHAKTRNEVIEFHHLVKFVKDEAKKAKDPVYGKDALKPVQAAGVGKKQNNNRHLITRSKSSFATSTLGDSRAPEDGITRSASYIQNNSKSDAQKNCLFCKGLSHVLEHCRRIKSIPVRERFEFLKTKGLCFGCLRAGHRKQDCVKRASCEICKGRHPTILHTEGKIFVNEVSPQSINSNEDRGNHSNAANLSSGLCGHTRAGEANCAMAIIPVKVKIRGKAQTVSTYAFFDTGSSVSFCSEGLLRQLGSRGKRMQLTLDTMGTPCTLNTFAVNGLQVCGINGEYTVELPKVYSKDKLPVGKEHIPKPQDIAPWSHLKEVELQQLDADIGLMIGSNVPDAYSPLQVRTGPPGSPHATQTRLGWIVWNVLRENSGDSCDHSNLVVNRAEISAIREIEQLQNLDRRVRDAINLDFPERLSDDRREYSVEDQKFIEHAQTSICKSDGHYSMDLPFRDKSVTMPNNCSHALQRLKGLRRKMSRDSQFRQDYMDFMNKILDKGYAEKVPAQDLQRNNGRVWYIPHHGVYHPRKPGKIRIVFDCSAMFLGTSLNEQLLQGPDLTNSLLGVLLRFRQEQIAIMGDIESMFFQVRVTESYVDCLRFFWWADGDIDQEPQQYRMLVHLFGAVSSPSCCNFALHRTVEDYGSQFESDVRDIVNRNMYVDDLLASVSTRDKAKALIRDTTALCSLGGFRLTKWVSSSVDVLDSVAFEDRAKDVKQLDFESGCLPSERALGVFWCVEADSFGFKIQLHNRSHTRRGILSIVSSVYDPLGMAAPFVLGAKILLQDLCKREVGWDEEITGSNLEKWIQWLADLPELETIQVRRCYKPAYFEEVKTCQIHSFSDASDVGYGIVFYLRLVNEKNEVFCSFLLGKSRVAPLKKISIPRMELTAATVAVRLYKTITRELQYRVDGCFFWTDSMSVLRYINNEKTRFHTFVANRVSVIRDGSNVNNWRYVETKINPADAASRGMSMRRFLENQQWLKGPDFLWQSESEWPQQIVAIQEIPEGDVEVKLPICSVTVAQTATDRFVSYYSDWNKLKRATAWLLLEIENLKNRVKYRTEVTNRIEQQESDPIRRKQLIDLEVNRTLKSKMKDCLSNVSATYLTIDMLQKAENSLLRYSQGLNFREELDVLRNSGKRLKRSSVLYKLDPVLMDGLIRVGGRLERAEISHDAKHPIILPRKSPVSHCLLEHIHRVTGHLGKNSILAVMRQKYWMISATSAIKALVHKCVTCRKYQAPCVKQKMANLPKSRLTPDEPPFTRTGMDYFGPFEIKRGRTTVKRYGVLFTCLTVRAVHLEVACSLDTDSCINAIHRFVSRRGTVKLILSDNGTNLVGAERELREEIEKWNAGRIRQVVQRKELSWDFNPPAASHFGGIWERLIRSVRKVLYSVMHEQVIKLDDEGLQTVFCEVEAILNNRPLTESPSSPHDLDVLTPNHLLLLKPGEHFPPGTFDYKDVYARRRWRQVQYLAEVFWGRWVKEYLPLLQQFQKWVNPQRNIGIGDLVLVMDSSPRLSWCLGRVLDVVSDKRGLVRIAKVKTQTSVLQRPVAKLCLILEGDLGL